MSFFIVNLLMLNYAAQIGILTEDTLSFWKGVKLGRMERQQVRGMQVVRMGMGDWFPIKKASAIGYYTELHC